MGTKLIISLDERLCGQIRERKSSRAAKSDLRLQPEPGLFFWPAQGHAHFVPFSGPTGPGQRGRVSTNRQTGKYRYLSPFRLDGGVRYPPVDDQSGGQARQTGSLNNPLPPLTALSFVTCRLSNFHFHFHLIFHFISPLPCLPHFTLLPVLRQLLSLLLILSPAVLATPDHTRFAHKPPRFYSIPRSFPPSTASFSSLIDQAPNTALCLSRP